MSGQQPIYLFADLDDSLFQTERKCPPGESLLTAALDRQGQPLSYFTRHQQALLVLLQQAVTIPVTGRNTVALERVQMEFTSYRITGHGAMIGDAHGNPLTEWLALQEAHFQYWLEPLQRTFDRFETVIAERRLPARCRLIEDRGVIVYLSVKGEEWALQALTETATRWWHGDHAQVHRNGGNMALLPPFANKARAVQFVMERLGATQDCPLFIGLGDSASDLPFLRLCHYAIIPRISQIQQALG